MRHGRLFGALLVSVAFASVGCTSEEAPSGGAAPPASSGAGAQVTQAPGSAAGPGCTLAQYGGQAVDLATAKIGFSQSETESNPFRIAETQSIRDAAAELGIPAGNLIVTNAGGQLPKQISDVQDMINQGVQAIIMAPLNSDGLDPALAAAQQKDIPVLTIDRKINATACEDYVAFLGSNFVEQGRIAAQQMNEALGGQGSVAILLGSSGNNVTTDRTNGFVEELGKIAPNVKIVAQQTGNFEREQGEQVAAQILQAQPDLTGIYAENDEMALGALVALRDAGKAPGQDIQVVSIDGTRNAVQEVVDGNFAAVVESNPRFGPLAFQTLQQFFGGAPIPQDVIISDKLYTKANAATEVASAY